MERGCKERSSRRITKFSSIMTEFSIRNGRVWAGGREEKENEKGGRRRLKAKTGVRCGHVSPISSNQWRRRRPDGEHETEIGAGESRRAKHD
jgi:hypothetical protein